MKPEDPLGDRLYRYAHRLTTALQTSLKKARIGKRYEVSMGPAGSSAERHIQLTWWRGGKVFLTPWKTKAINNSFGSGIYVTPGEAEVSFMLELIDLDFEHAAALLSWHFPIIDTFATIENACFNEDESRIEIICDPDERIELAEPEGGALNFKFRTDETIEQLLDMMHRLTDVHGFQDMEGREVRLRGYRDPQGHLHPFAFGHIEKPLFLEPAQTRESVLEDLVTENLLELPLEMEKVQ